MKLRDLDLPHAIAIRLTFGHINKGGEYDEELADMLTVEELLSKKYDDQLLKIKNLGRGTLYKLHTIARAHMGLPPEPPTPLKQVELAPDEEDLLIIGELQNSFNMEQTICTKLQNNRQQLFAKLARGADSRTIRINGKCIKIGKVAGKWRFFANQVILNGKKL